MCGPDIEEGQSPYHDGYEFKKQDYEKRIEELLPTRKLTVNDRCYNCDAIKFASERIHTLIVDENGLRHNRMTWFANIEGFLWLSFAAVISEKVGWENGFWLMILIPIVGILVCLSAISAILDADYACNILVKKWRVLQNHERCWCSVYTEIPVVGLSNDEMKQGDRIHIPRWNFALFILLGWIFGLIGIVVTKICLCLGLPWWHYILSMFVGWVAGLAVVLGIHHCISIKEKQCQES